MANGMGRQAYCPPRHLTRGALHACTHFATLRPCRLRGGSAGAGVALASAGGRHLAPLRRCHRDRRLWRAGQQRGGYQRAAHGSAGPGRAGFGHHLRQHHGGQRRQRADRHRLRPGGQRHLVLGITDRPASRCARAHPHGGRYRRSEEARSDWPVLCLPGRCRVRDRPVATGDVPSPRRAGDSTDLQSSQPAGRRLSGARQCGLEP